MSSSGVTNKDFSDGMQDGESLAKWVMLSKLKQMEKVYAPNSSGGRAIKELKQYIGKPFNLIACIQETLPNNDGSGLAESHVVQPSPKEAPDLDSLIEALGDICHESYTGCQKTESDEWEYCYKDEAINLLSKPEAKAAIAQHIAEAYEKGYREGDDSEKADWLRMLDEAFGIQAESRSEAQVAIAEQVEAENRHWIYVYETALELTGNYESQEKRQVWQDCISDHEERIAKLRREA